MSEPTSLCTANGRTREYQLSSAEQRYLKRFHQMQNEATQKQKPQVLMVYFDGRTVAFFAGNPSGIERGE